MYLTSIKHNESSSASVIKPYQEYPLNATTLEANVWFIGRRKGAYVAISCTQATTLGVSEIKGRSPEGANFHFLERVCPRSRHAWTCLVATIDEYETLEDFLLLRVLALVVTESNRDAPPVSQKRLFSCR